MRKLLVWTTILSFLIGLLVILPNTMQAAAGYKDQYNEGAIVNTLACHNNRAQSFIPVVDRITRINVYLTNRISGTPINLSLRDESSQAITWSNNHGMGGPGSGWEDFVQDAGVPVTPGSLYSIILDIGSNTPRWAYSGDSYPNGAMLRFNGSIWQPTYANDFLFQVWGYYPEGTTPPPGAEPETPGIQPEAPTELPVNSEIQPPVLSYLVKSERHINAPIKGTLEASTKDSLKASGTSFAGSKVVLFINDKAQATTTDTDGNWTYDFDMASYKDNEVVTVKGQAQNDQGAGSNIVELFKFKKVPKKILFMPVGEDFAIPYWIYLAFAGAILAVIILYLISRAKKKGTQPASAVQKIPERKKLGSGK